MQLNAVKIVICQNKYNKKEIELNESDLDIINLIYYKAKILGLELIDHIVISNLGIKSLTPLYYSHLEHGLMTFVSQDVKYKTVIEVRTELEQYEKDHSSDLFKIRKEQIVTRLIDMGIDIKTIIQTTNISESEVNEIKQSIEYADEEEI